MEQLHRLHSGPNISQHADPVRAWQLEVISLFVRLCMMVLKVLIRTAVYARRDAQRQTVVESPCERQMRWITALINHQNWRGVCSACNDAVQAHGEVPFIYFARGLAHRGLGMLDEAIADCCVRLAVTCSSEVSPTSNTRPMVRANTPSRLSCHGLLYRRCVQ